MYKTSGLFGATAIPIAPGPRPPIRRSSFTRSQVSPPSSERYTPAFLRASTEAYTRLGRLGATAMPMRPRPSALPGSPFVNSCHVSPPSVGLYRQPGEMLPGFTAIRGLVDAVANRKIGPLQSFAASHVNDIGIGRSHGNRSHGTGRLIVEDGPPRISRVRRLPHAAVHRRHIENVR